MLEGITRRRLDAVGLGPLEGQQHDRSARASIRILPARPCGSWHLSCGQTRGQGRATPARQRGRQAQGAEGVWTQNNMNSKRLVLCAYAHPGVPRSAPRLRMSQHSEPIHRTVILTRRNEDTLSYPSWIYTNRNQVEKLLAKLKEWRAVATRYEKTARSFMGIFYLAAACD